MGLTSAERSKLYRERKKRAACRRACNERIRKKMKQSEVSKEMNSKQVVSQRRGLSKARGSFSGDVACPTGSEVTCGEHTMETSLGDSVTGPLLGVAVPANGFSREERRAAALRNIVQFRRPGRVNVRLMERNLIQCVRDDIRSDLIEAKKIMNPRSYTVCVSCGLEFYGLHLGEHFDAATVAKWSSSFLKKRLFARPGGSNSFFCHSCRRELEKGKPPLYAAVRGWNLLEETPVELSELTKYERILISLRIPCIYTWRGQGGTGQYASKGAAISFANPVAELAKSLPWSPRRVFSTLMETGNVVRIRSSAVQDALIWLMRHNHLYKSITIDVNAILEIRSIEEDMSVHDVLDVMPPNHADLEAAEEEECERGTQGPVDGEEVYYLKQHGTCGIQYTEEESARDLITHMLKPFKHRRHDIIPSYDAARNLESYFPVLFPSGKGGPETVGKSLSAFCKYVLSVQNSKFSKDLDFIFFVNAVMRRRRLSGLCANAPLRDRTTNAIMRIRQMLREDMSSDEIARRIDYMLRSGVLSATFETVKGCPAFWSNLKRDAWCYLVRFGPCHLFVTMSVADVTDPYIYMDIDQTLCYEEARKLSVSQRSSMLAHNPVAATKTFYRRLKAFFDFFLFGRTSPFGKISAYLGRIEQQNRCSPHLHILIWLHEPMYAKVADDEERCASISAFVEQFATAILPGESNESSCLDISSNFVDSAVRRTIDENKKLPGHVRHDILSEEVNINIFDGSDDSERRLRNIFVSCQHHVCNRYCRPQGKQCRFKFPHAICTEGGVKPMRKANGLVGNMVVVPRNNMHMNSTHLLLTAMFRANTDVTVIAGNSIAEAMYVCSYAVKADKETLFDSRAVNRLKEIFAEDVEDRSVLSYIARSCENIRIVGGQEVTSYLLGTDLTFHSAKVLEASLWFILNTEGAINEEERNRLYCYGNSESEDVLGQLECDEEVAVPQKVVTSFNERTNCNVQNRRFSAMVKKGGLEDRYMRRPDGMEGLSLSEFHEQYRVVNVRKGQIEEAMKLRSEGANTSEVARKRNNVKNRPDLSVIVNVRTRGKADIQDPFFCASALLLHVPFRSVENLLEGNTVTQRLQEILESGECEQVTSFVERGLALANGSNCDIGLQNSIPQEERESGDGLSDNEDEPCESDRNEFEAIQEQNLCDEEDQLDSNRGEGIEKVWEGRSAFEERKLDIEGYNRNVSTVKQLGISRANDVWNGICVDVGSNQGCTPRIDYQFVSMIKKGIIGKCRTKEQKEWLRFACSYLELYYKYNIVQGRPELRERYERLLRICEKNPIILTNAPGGCGKSWLVDQVKTFVRNCIPFTCTPSWLATGVQEETDISDIFVPNGSAQEPDSQKELSEEWVELRF